MRNAPNKTLLALGGVAMTATMALTPATPAIADGTIGSDRAAAAQAAYGWRTVSYHSDLASCEAASRSVIYMGSWRFCQELGPGSYALNVWFWN